MKKFLDILDECCKDGGECKCKKGEKCNSSTCKCKPKKAVKESEAHKEETEGYEAGYDGKKKSECPYSKGDWKYKAWMEGYANAKEDKSTEFGKGIKEAKNDDDERGDWKMHQKKDDALDKDKCKFCGSTKGYTLGRCISCGVPIHTKKTVKESKFDQYLEESKLDEGIEAQARTYYKSYVEANKGGKVLSFEDWLKDVKAKTLKAGFTDGDIIAYLKKPKSGIVNQAFRR